MQRGNDECDNGHAGIGDIDGIISIYCDCGRPIENRDTGKCSTCGRNDRKIPKTKQRKRIRSVSPARAKQLAEYSRERALWLPGKKCAVYPHLDAVEIHHMKGKRGKWLLDKKYWLPVSRKGHDKITYESEWALDNGFTVLRSN